MYIVGSEDLRATDCLLVAVLRIICCMERGEVPLWRKYVLISCRFDIKCSIHPVQYNPILPPAPSKTCIVDLNQGSSVASALSCLCPLSSVLHLPPHTAASRLNLELQKRDRNGKERLGFVLVPQWSHCMTSKSHGEHTGDDLPINDRVPS